MFKKTLVLAALAALSAGAFASEATDAPEFNFVSTKTRAEVRAELDAARKAGELSYGETDFSVKALKSTSTKTRAEVKAELAEYIKSGQRDRDAALIWAP